MRLLLADGPPSIQTAPPVHPNSINPYIRIPAVMSPTGEVTYVREDYFDWMTEGEFADMMAQIFQLEEEDGTLGLFKAIGDALRTSVQARNDRKMVRTQGRVDRRNVRVGTKGDARIIRADRGAATGWDVVGQGIQTYGDVAQKGLEVAGPLAAAYMNAQSGGGFPMGFPGGPPPQGFGMNLPPWVLPVAAAGVIGYLIMRKRS